MEAVRAYSHVKAVISLHLTISSIKNHSVNNTVNSDSDVYEDRLMGRDASGTHSFYSNDGQAL